MTVYDVAQKAGVSTATVSRVINNKGNVSAKTRDIILRVIEESGFTVNNVAQSLALSDTRTVAMLAADIRESYYSEIAYALGCRLSKAGYRSYYCNVGTNSDEQTALIQDMLSRRVSGIVFIGTPAQSDTLLSALLTASRQVPVVVSNVKIPGENIYCIERDDALGFRLCIDHLASLGCRNLTFLANMHWYSDRLKQAYFEEHVATHYKDRLKARVLTCSPGIEGGYAFSAKFDDDLKEVDGVVCATDPIAVGLVKGLTARGKRVPEDVKVTGYDNTNIVQYTTPTITSVDSDMLRQGELSAELMLKCFEGHKPEMNYHLITPRLVVRESTIGISKEGEA